MEASLILSGSEKLVAVLDISALDHFNEMVTTEGRLRQDLQSLVAHYCSDSPANTLIVHLHPGMVRLQP